MDKQEIIDQLTEENTKLKQQLDEINKRVKLKNYGINIEKEIT